MIILVAIGVVVGGAVIWASRRTANNAKMEVLLTIGRERETEWRLCSLRLNNLADEPTRLLEIGLRSPGGRIAPAIFPPSKREPDVARNGKTVLIEKDVPPQDYRDVDFFLKHPADRTGEHAPLIFTMAAEQGAGRVAKLKIRAVLPQHSSHPFQWTKRGPRRPEVDYRLR